MLVKIYKTGMFLAIVSILLGIAYLMDAVIELTAMLICFLIAKQKYKFK